MAAMKYRKLRIAWSVAWGIACLLLVVLWVRSYSYRSNFQAVALNHTFQCSLLAGTIHLCIGTPFPDWATGFWEKHHSDPYFDNWDHPNSPAFNFSVNQYGAGSVAVEFPYWFPPLITMILATAPWLRWRFSLRTLLIAMTLVAVGLGAIVWAAR